MSVLNRDEFFNRVHQRVGTDNSDEAIKFIEDMSDTFNSLEERANGDGTDWEKKYHELDESWKKKYRHRFFSGGIKCPPPETEEKKKKDGSSITIDDLFEQSN